MVPPKLRGAFIGNGIVRVSIVANDGTNGVLGFVEMATADWNTFYAALNVNIAAPSQVPVDQVPSINTAGSSNANQGCTTSPG